MLLLSAILLNVSENMSNSSEFLTVDIVFDRYRALSVTSVTRVKRAKVTLMVFLYEEKFFSFSADGLEMIYIITCKQSRPNFL